MVLMYPFQLESETSVPTSQVNMFLYCFASLLITLFVINVDGRLLKLSSESGSALQNYAQRQQSSIAD